GPDVHRNRVGRVHRRGPYRRVRLIITITGTAPSPGLGAGRSGALGWNTAQHRDGSIKLLQTILFDQPRLPGARAALASSSAHVGLSRVRPSRRGTAVPVEVRAITTGSSPHFTPQGGA
ncbi:MAG: hypothetical protein ACRDSI_17845, partial [Pseudonocardiaceae bacterium]